MCGHALKHFLFIAKSTWMADHYIFIWCILWFSVAASIFKSRSNLKMIIYKRETFFAKHWSWSFQADTNPVFYNIDKKLAWVIVWWTLFQFWTPPLWPNFIWILAEFREGLPFWPHFIWVLVQFRGIAVFGIIRFTMENGLPAEGCQRIWNYYLILTKHIMFHRNLQPKGKCLNNNKMRQLQNLA